MKKINAPNFLVILLAMLVISSCKKPFDGINIVVKPEVIKYTALLKIVDAADGSEPLKSTITFSGANGQSIYDLAGKKTFTVNNGFVSFGLSPSKTPLVDNPVNVSVIISAPGYLTVTKPLNFTAGEFEQSIEAQLVNITKPGKGVSAVSINYALANNILSKAVAFKTPLSAGKQEYTAVNVTAGTRFRDKDGNQISGGTLNVQTLHFDTRNESSLSAFPGGLTPTAVTLQDGTQAPGTFITAGFASIDFKDGNTAVKSFDRAIRVTMTADPKLINPETQLAIKEGDKIPVWSYSAEDGNWKYETTASITRVNDTMKVAFNTTHLTWYNLAWYFKTCSATKSFKIAGGSELNDSYVLQIFSRNSSRALRTTYVYGSTDSSFTLHNIPNVDLKLRIYRTSEFNAKAYYTGQGTQTTNFTETDYMKLCTAGGSINFPKDTRQTITFELVGVCTTKNVEIRPSGYVYYRDVTTGTPSAGYHTAYISEGKFATKDLQLDHTYEVVSYYGSSSFTFTRKLEFTRYNERLVLKGKYCDGF